MRLAGVAQATLVLAEPPLTPRGAGGLRLPATDICDPCSSRAHRPPRDSRPLSPDLIDRRVLHCLRPPRRNAERGIVPLRTSRTRMPPGYTADLGHRN